MDDPPELAEDVELAVEHRRYVLEVFARLATLDHYQLLGVPRNADRKVVRRTYFHLAGFIHPDRYFRKNLGTYKPKLEAIFSRMTTAYETLSSPEARATYDATLPPEAGDAPGAPSAALPAAPAPKVDPVAEAKRQAAVDSLRQTFEAGKARGAQYAQAAARARSAGDVVGAAEHYRKALAFAPGDAALKAALDEVEKLAAERVVGAHRRQALLEESHEKWDQAAASWKRVADARPDDAEARTRHAAAALRASGRRPA